MGFGFLRITIDEKRGNETLVLKGTQISLKPFTSIPHLDLTNFCEEHYQVSSNIFHI